MRKRHQREESVNVFETIGGFWLPGFLHQIHFGKDDGRLDS